MKIEINVRYTFVQYLKGEQDRKGPWDVPREKDYSGYM